MKSELDTLIVLICALAAWLVIDNLPMIIARSRLTGELSGLYGVLYNLRNTIKPFSFAIALPFYSQVLSRHSERTLLRKAIVLVTLLAAVFLIVAWCCPGWLIQTLYGEAYAGAARFMIAYGVSFYIQMLTLIVMFHQIAKKKLRSFLLGIPLAVLLVGVFAGELTIERLIVSQIAASLMFLAVLMIPKSLQSRANEVSA